MSHFCSPLRYPGGKNCIFPFVSKLLYENELIGATYAEPYAGGAGLALRLLFNEYVEKIYINDLDKSIYAFWFSVLEHSDEFCDWLENIDASMENWFLYKKIQNEKMTKDLLELAKSTFFLNRTNVSGIIKGGVIGGIEQKGRYKIDARLNKKELIDRIQKIKQFKKRIFISNLDALIFIEKMEKKSKETFIYIDPPYLQKEADLYINSYTKSDHKNLSRRAHRMKEKWMISYDYHDLIMNLYSSKNKMLYKLSQSASNRTGNEVLIFPDSIEFSDSIKFLANPSCV